MDNLLELIPGTYAPDWQDHDSRYEPATSYLILSVDDDKETIIHCADELLEYTGYSAEELFGQNVDFLSGPATAPEARNMHNDLISKSIPGTVHILHHRKDGSAFEHRLRYTPMPTKDSRKILWLIETAFIGNLDLCMKALAH